MSLNPEALQKLLIEMDNQLNKSKAELNMCTLQLDRVETNLNLIHQTSKSLQTICDVENNETVWQGVGRSFVRNDIKSYLTTISKDEAEFLDNQKSLMTKKHYLETTLEKTVDNMTKLVGGTNQ